MQPYLCDTLSPSAQHIKTAIKYIQYIQENVYHPLFNIAESVYLLKYAQ